MVELSKPEFIFLQQEDVIACGGADMTKALADVERAFVVHGRKELRQPIKTTIEFPGDGTTRRDHLMVAMPVYIGGSLDMAGLKWASESVDNTRRGDLPYGIDILVLNDVKRAHPIAMLDGSLITAMRTAAAAGVAAKYLARPDAQVAAVIGAGAVGSRAVEAIGLSLPSLKELRIFDLNGERAQAVAAKYAGRWQMQVASSAQEVVEGADVVATFTTTREPFIQAAWLKEGCCFTGMGKNEVEDQALLSADRLVTDEWESFLHYGTPHVVKLYHEGKIKDTDIVNLEEIILGHAKGRTSPSQRIVFLSLGMGCEDMLVAERVYREAKARGLGQTLSLWDATDLR